MQTEREIHLETSQSRLTLFTASCITEGYVYIFRGAQTAPLWITSTLNSSAFLLSISLTFISIPLQIKQTYLNGQDSLILSSVFHPLWGRGAKRRAPWMLKKLCRASQHSGQEAHPKRACTQADCQLKRKTPDNNKFPLFLYSQFPIRLFWKRGDSSCQHTPGVYMLHPKSTARCFPGSENRRQLCAQIQ